MHDDSRSSQDMASRHPDHSWRRYALLPLAAVPLWAYHEDRWILLLGIYVFCFFTMLASFKPSIFPLLTAVCVAFWVRSGFDIHNVLTFFFLCGFWGHAFFLLAVEPDGSGEPAVHHPRARVATK